METVVPVNSTVFTYKKLEEELPKPEQVAEKADEQIGQLSVDPRWKALQDIIDGMIQTLERVDGITNDDTPETIGFKFLVSRLVSSQLKIVRDLPDTLASAVQDGGAETK